MSQTNVDEALQVSNIYDCEEICNAAPSCKGFSYDSKFGLCQAEELRTTNTDDWGSNTRFCASRRNLFSLSFFISQN